ncbi:MAG TPA: polysaccharide biosynthesis C-terminal domain-containing protein [Flavobacterium sp.]
MGLYKSLFKQTAIYGIATVLPRMLSFLLVPLYTDVLEDNAAYGEVSVLFAWIVFFNVVLSYGMETAFFRFYSKAEDKENVISTSTISIFTTSIIFLIAGLLFQDQLAYLSDKAVHYIVMAIWIIVFDALVIIPFSKLRATGRPMVYAAIKIGNVFINVVLNLFFLLLLPTLAQQNPGSFFDTIYFDNFQIGYIFVANLIASLLTFLFLSPDYFRIKWKFDTALWKTMMIYALPILFAGIAFAINEHFDKILLEYLLPEAIAKSETGAYSACYKIALFMTLFATAFRLGIEPFFFSHAQSENAPQTYADITKYFVIIGSVILITVIVFADIIKIFLLQDRSYWVAMEVVPLIILANFFLGIYANLSVWYKLTDKTKMGAYISLVGAAVTLSLNFLLIPYISYYGSAIATLAAYGSMMVISYYLGAKHYPIPYDIKKITFYITVSSAFSAVYFYGFRENYFVGFPLLLLYLIIIYRMEKQTFYQILGRSSRS